MSISVSTVEIITASNFGNVIHNYYYFGINFTSDRRKTGAFSAQRNFQYQLLLLFHLLSLSKIMSVPVFTVLFYFRSRNLNV